MTLANVGLEELLGIIVFSSRLGASSLQFTGKLSIAKTYQQSVANQGQ